MVALLEMLQDPQDGVRHAINVRQEGLRDDAYAHGRSAPRRETTSVVIDIKGWQRTHEGSEPEPLGALDHADLRAQESSTQSREPRRISRR